MPSWLPSVPYPPPDQPGYWDPVTSTLQWCEEDYYLTYYSAEIVNTLTNSIFLYLAYKGVTSCQKHGHDLVFEVAYFGYFLVAIGSLMFHSTLKYPWQLVDELNMIYTTCLLCWASLTYRRSILAHWLLGIFFISFCGGITAYYHYLQDPDFHQNVYAAISVFIISKTCIDMEVALRPKWRHSLEADRIAKVKKGLPALSREEQERVNQRDLDILKQLWLLVLWGVSIFLCGFALWGIDNQYCGTLRSWRRELGMPWGFFLELHGWWHLMTGTGAYACIVWGCYLRHVLNGNQDVYGMDWASWFSLPEVVRIDGSKAHVNGNGLHSNGNGTSARKENGSTPNGTNSGMNGSGHLRNGKARK